MKRLALISVVALCATAHAEFWDGNKLLEKINSHLNYEQGMALGYIMGVADTGLGISHCTPANATAGQLHDMVLIHLRAFPERRTRTADSIVMETLKAAWPCQRSNGSRSL
jgi:hypothetical protein